MFGEELAISDSCLRVAGFKDPSTGRGPLEEEMLFDD